jgi:VCBS repeat protein
MTIARLRAIVRTIAAATIVAVSTRSARAQLDFDVPTVAPGPAHGPIFVGDLDGDRIPDMVAFDNVGFNIEAVVFRGDGRGFLERTQVLPVPGGVSGGVLADLDGAGVLDLAVTTAGVVSVFQGDGNGTFVGSGTVQTAPSARNTVAIDVDRDGHLDLVMADGTTSAITILFGDGGLSFPVRQDLPIGCIPDQLVAGDLDGDGISDIVVSCPRISQVVSFLGDGNGGFVVPRAYAVPGIQTLALARLDGDDALDLVVLSSGSFSDGVYVLRGRGTGGFLVPVRVANPQGPQRVLVTDFDRDGRLDLAVTAFSAAASRDTIELLRGRGDGTFTPFGVLPGGTGLTWLAAADLDRDGWNDLVVDGLVIYRSSGPRSFRMPQLVPTDAPPAGIALGDFDGDSKADLLVTTVARGGIGVVGAYLADGIGGFHAAVPVRLQFLPQLVRVADVDGDGDLDALAEIPGAGRIYVLLGDGHGALSIGESIESLGYPSDVAIADFDGDGIHDVAVAENSNNRIGLFHGDGAGGFVSSSSLPFDEPNLLVVADFNEDGHPDIASASLQFIALFMSDGNGGFDTIFEPYTGDIIRSIVAGDLDADGHADLLYARTRSDGTPVSTILFGDGRAGFRSFAGPAISPRRSGIVLADLDEDGHVDIAADSGDGVTVCFGEGDGTFPSSRSWFWPCTTLVSGDFDGDGHPDLATMLLTDPVVGLILNRAIRPVEALRGNVNAAAGPITDVLFVDESVGAGPTRTLIVSPDDPLQIRMDAPPSRVGRQSRFALYAWFGIPTSETTRDLPFGLGPSAMPMPLDSAGPRPPHVWNNIGHAPLLGMPNHPSTPAPSIVVADPRGTRVQATFTLQGVIVDDASPSGVAAVTNGIVVTSRR